MKNYALYMFFAKKNPSTSNSCTFSNLCLHLTSSTEVSGLQSIVLPIRKWHFIVREIFPQSLISSQVFNYSFSSQINKMHNQLILNSITYFPNLNKSLLTNEWNKFLTTEGQPFLSCKGPLGN